MSIEWLTLRYQQISNRTRPPINMPSVLPIAQPKGSGPAPMMLKIVIPEQNKVVRMKHHNHLQSDWISVQFWMAAAEVK